MRKRLIHQLLAASECVPCCHPGEPEAAGEEEPGPSFQKGRDQREAVVFRCVRKSLRVDPSAALGVTDARTAFFLIVIRVPLRNLFRTAQSSALTLGFAVINVVRMTPDALLSNVLRVRAHDRVICQSGPNLGHETSKLRRTAAVVCGCRQTGRNFEIALSHASLITDNANWGDNSPNEIPAAYCERRIGHA